MGGADHTKSFTTSTRYDTWNRVLQTTYPDGETLTYGYDSGGQVTSATGVKGSDQYTYLARTDYDKFEQKVLTDTGSGVRTIYSYNDTDRRLATVKSAQPDGREFQNLSYGYDKVGNISVMSAGPLDGEGVLAGGLPSGQVRCGQDLWPGA